MALLSPFSRPMMMDLPALISRLPRISRALRMFPGRFRKKLIIPRIPLLTVVLRAFHALVVTRLAVSRALRRTFPVADATLGTRFLMPFQTLDAVFRSPFHSPTWKLLIPFQT